MQQKQKNAFSCTFNRSIEDFLFAVIDVIKMALPNIWESGALNDYYSSCITFKCNRFLENEQECIRKQFSILALVSILV